MLLFHLYLMGRRILGCGSCLRRWKNMGQKNAVTKRFCSDKIRFADLINGVYFQGREIIHPKDLTEGSEVYAEPLENDSGGKNRDYLERIRDIKMRMLTPRELYSAMGFPSDYVIEHDYTGKEYPRLTFFRRRNEASSRRRLSNSVYSPWRGISVISPGFFQRLRRRRD